MVGGRLVTGPEEAGRPRVPVWPPGLADGDRPETLELAETPKPLTTHRVSYPPRW